MKTTGEVRYRNGLHTLKGTLETLGVGVAERPGRVSNNAAGSSRSGGDWRGSSTRWVRHCAAIRGRMIKGTSDTFACRR